MFEVRIFQQSDYNCTKLVFESAIDAANFIASASQYCKRRTKFELIVRVGDESEDD